MVVDEAIAGSILLIVDTLPTVAIALVVEQIRMTLVVTQFLKEEIIDGNLLSSAMTAAEIIAMQTLEGIDLIRVIVTVRSGFAVVEMFTSKTVVAGQTGETFGEIVAAVIDELLIGGRAETIVHTIIQSMFGDPLMAAGTRIEVRAITNSIEGTDGEQSTDLDVEVAEESHGIRRKIKI